MWGSVFFGSPKNLSLFYSQSRTSPTFRLMKAKMPAMIKTTNAKEEAYPNFATPTPKDWFQM